MSQRSQTVKTDSSARSVDPYLLLALFLSLVAAAPLLIGPGIVNTRAGGDSPFLLQRVHQLSVALHGGAFPVRWMPDSAYGLGYPAFSYYAAFPYYLAAFLNLAGLGTLWGIKATQALGFLLAGGGAYLLARAAKSSKIGALVASAAYTYAPFHLVNVYVRGDSLSEFYAMALFPIILWCLLCFCQRPSPGRAAALAATYALLVLSHNISALLFSPLLGVWLLVASLRQGSRRGLQCLLVGAATLGLGLLLSVWFWGPALHERTVVQLTDQTTGYFHFAGHFAEQGLVQWRFSHDYGISGDTDPFSIGLWQALLALCGIAALLVRRFQGERQEASYPLALLALFVYAWLMTPSSNWFWERAPLLAYAQFPWRLLSVQALAIALLSAQIPDLAPRKSSLAFGMICVLLAGLSGLVGIQPDRLPIRDGEITPERLMLYETYSGNIGGTVRHEYLPIEMVPRPYTSGVQLNGGDKPAPLALEGQLLKAEHLTGSPTSETWEIEVADRSLLAFHTTFFPGWAAWVDGIAREVEPIQGLGLVGVRLEPGRHLVSLALERTPVRRYAELASGAGLFILLVLALYACSRSRQYRLRALTCAVGLLLLGLWLAIAPHTAGRTAERGPLVMDYSRAPFLHREPQGVFWAESESAEASVRLLGYALSHQAAAPGDRVTVEMAWTSSLPGVGVTLELKAATAHFSGPSPVWAKVSRPIDAETLSLELALPDDIPPGLFVLECLVRYDDEDLAPYTVTGREMASVALQPIQIEGHRLATGDEPVLSRFGPENQPPPIALIGVQSEQSSDRRLEVTLNWRSERQAPLNYMLSLRLLSADGARLATRDLPPLQGGYPTSLWRPGELITDRVLLKLPKGTQLSGSERLEVVLYDRVTLLGMGAAQLPLSLNRP